jgi:hypothetical protein
MGSVRPLIAAALGRLAAPAVGVVLLLVAGLWSQVARRHADLRLRKLLESSSIDVRRYAVQSVANPSQHATTLLRYCRVERDGDILSILAQRVQTCRRSRSQSRDWLTLRLWAFTYAPPDRIPPG